MAISPLGGAGGIMFSIIPTIVIIVFVIVFVTIIVRVIQGIGQWGRNNASPVLTVDATVVTKRMDVDSYYNNNVGANNMNMATMSSDTTYYATFQVASGDRMEFKVPDAEYGMLVENDFGKLTFQGTRYLGFVRSGIQSTMSINSNNYQS